jgi:glycosyltransferase involved in cell wall biosynthesis
VTFAGERHDVAAMLSSLDLFIAASDQETFGLSVLEALANGIPALYTTCPALEGIETGRARQVPGEVAGLREEITAEVTRGRRHREGVPAIAERYGIESVTRRIDDLYDRLMASRNPARLTRQALPNPVGGNR